MIKKNFIFLILVGIGLLGSISTKACTGITLTSKDSSRIVARTIEWGGSKLHSRYVVVPRGYKQYALIPEKNVSGMTFIAHYGYVGLSVEQEEFVAEGLNEAGLSAGLFYFPGYGKYEEYNPNLRESSISDLQLVSWILSNFKSVDEAKEGIRNIHIVNTDPRSSTVHWRIADKTGRQIVLEIIDCQMRFYENPLGVLTNAPDFTWQLTNLNNYVNLYPGDADRKLLGNITLAPFGAGTGFIGIPGDVTPPSRFVRAAFYQSTAPQQDTAWKTVLQGFQILNSFDIPIGIEFPVGKVPVEQLSATQWTVVTDMTNKNIYYRTMYNSTIRCIQLDEIDFNNIQYCTMPLDKVERQPVTVIKIK